MENSAGDYWPEGLDTVFLSNPDPLSTYMPNEANVEYPQNGEISLMYPPSAVSGFMCQTEDISSASACFTSTEPWTGDYNFQVHFSDSEDKTKQTPWTYSPKLRKLFVNMDKACPVKFTLNPAGIDYRCFTVVANLVYAKAEDAIQPVERCINHKESSVKKGDIFSEHILRCDQPEKPGQSGCEQPEYFSSNGRFYVQIPMEAPLPGNGSILRHYRLMCLSSCIGGINRRPTILVFSLMLNGVPVGRQVVTVRVCSCPGRDRSSEEEKQKPRTGETSMVSLTIPPPPEKGKKRKLSPQSSTMVNASLPAQLDELGNEYRDFRVYGRENIESIQALVNRLNDAYFEIANTRRILEQQLAPVNLQQVKEEPGDFPQ